MPLDMEREMRALQKVLAERQLTHLHVTKRGKTFTLHVGHPDNPEPEARLTQLASGLWRLDLHHHSGRWESTPFQGGLVELIDTAAGIGRLQDF